MSDSFNGWWGGCAPMSDPDLDGIWEVTIVLTAETYEYKFAYDSEGHLHLDTQNFI